MTRMREPDYIPEGTVIECSCGATFGDLAGWREHEETHDDSPSWELMDAHTGRDIS